MTRRRRIAWFGGSALLAAVGLTVVLAASGSVVAEAAGIFLMSVGFLVLVMLAFLEIGLSEDRDREQAERKVAARRAKQEPRRPKVRRPPRRPD